MKERKNIEEKYKWDLSKIYVNIEEFEKDFKHLEEQIIDIDLHKNDMLNNGYNLYVVLKSNFDIERKLSKLYNYSNLLFDSDTSINSNQEYKERVNNLYELFCEKTYFIEPNLIKLTNEELKKFYQEKPELIEYENVIRRAIRFHQYILSDESEKLLSTLEKSMGNNNKTYELFKDCDMVFDNIKNENGESVEFSDSLYGIYIESKSRKVRKNAFETLYKSYRQYINTFASMLYGEIKEYVSISKVRGYDSCLQMALFPDELTPEIYNNLISVVNKRLNILHKYYNMKKAHLGYEELHLYDVYVSMEYNYDRRYNFEESFDIVVAALKPLGDEYNMILRKSFEERWIDVYPNKGKRGGGYSSGCYDSNPYILLNYLNRYNDMSTLAHELGHSMHSYYSRKNNTFQDSSYTLFVAEVASTVNELLLSKYTLENSNSKEEKLYVLNNLMELFRATLYRQVMFAEFEKDIYDDVFNDEVLTADMLCTKYYKLNKKYFGNEVIVDDSIKYEWARIPHFYYNFYVYKYATGLSAACYIVENIILKGKSKQYIEFLKCGSTKSPIDSLKVTGVDLTKPEVIESALKMFDDTIKKYEEISLQD